MPPRSASPLRVCFVCLGNICRSPTAEAVFRELVASAALEDHIEVQSAGTADYHVGIAPDARSREAGARRGLRVDGAARHFVAMDFANFDYVVAMDRNNRRDLEEIAPDDDARARIHLLRDFEATPRATSDTPPSGRAAKDVPDPYYGEADGFDRVLDICEVACAELLAAVVRDHGLRADD